SRRSTSRPERPRVARLPPSRPARRLFRACHLDAPPRQEAQHRPLHCNATRCPSRVQPATMLENALLILFLIAASAFFSVAEISLAASRRLRLRQLADEGDARAERVLRMQEQPGDYFTVVQVGLNAVAILGGIVGEGALSPHFAALFG